ncbi:hypothetical protein F5Y16DRAFT_369532 [Xylariaceae sp. FL0255]|nr:hypothetical protein F5Y16DRAFT_369532 [Xylariaceae sp. FL0255]
MPSRQILRMHKISLELKQYQAIPSPYLAILEERLVIFFKTLGRQQRKEHRSAIQDVRSRHKQRKAQKVYLDILNGDVFIFLPFLLAISPRAYESFDTVRFLGLYAPSSSITLCDTVKVFLHDISQSHGINQSPHYQKLIQALFSDSFQLQVLEKNKLSTSPTKLVSCDDS